MRIVALAMMLRVKEAVTMVKLIRVAMASSLKHGGGIAVMTEMSGDELEANGGGDTDEAAACGADDDETYFSLSNLVQCHVWI